MVRIWGTIGDVDVEAAAADVANPVKDRKPEELGTTWEFLAMTELV
jgi:hypothetical protein